MIGKVIQGLLLLVGLTGRAQDCLFPLSTVRPFVAGHVAGDSLTVEEILGAGKLATKNNAFEIVSFHISTGGGCLGGGGMFSELHCNSNDITSQAALLLKRSPGQQIFFDHVHAVDEKGGMYCLKPVSVYVKKTVKHVDSDCKKQSRTGILPGSNQIYNQVNYSQSIFFTRFAAILPSR